MTDPTPTRPTGPIVAAEAPHEPESLSSPDALTGEGESGGGTAVEASKGELEGPDVDQPEPPSSPERRSRLRGFLGLLGPGLITGAADDDPSGVATYSQAGAGFGNTLLWTAPLALPLMYAVQEICDRTALATGDSLGTLIRRKFNAHFKFVIGVLLVALIVANTLNIAADLAAIGQGMELMHLGPDHVWAAVAGVGLSLLLIFGSFERIAGVFKWLCLVLLAYVFVLVVAKVHWADVGAGTIGLHMQWSWDAAAIIVAVLGTTISPYMFFWQSAHRVEEMRAEGDGPQASYPLLKRRRRNAERKLWEARVDVFFGMLVSTLVMFAIMVACAATIGKDGPVDINTAADAAKALEPIAGKYASIIFALGFVGTGMLAVPVLAASGSIALSGLLNKNWGFDHSPKKAPVFYGLLLLGTIGGVIIAFLYNDPIKLLVLSATINGIAAGPFLVVVMLVAMDKKLMGRMRNGWLSNIVGWFTTILMLVAGGIGVYTTLTGH